MAGFALRTLPTGGSLHEMLSDLLEQTSPKVFGHGYEMIWSKACRSSTTVFAWGLLQALPTVLRTSQGLKETYLSGPRAEAVEPEIAQMSTVLEATVDLEGVFCESRTKTLSCHSFAFTNGAG